MNALTMTGNLVADPELAYAGETPVATMRLAVDNGRYPTTYIDVASYGEQAYPCVEFLRKGRKVAVSGRLALEEWRNKSEEPRRRYRVIGRVEFLDRRGDMSLELGGGGHVPPEPEPSGSGSEAGLQLAVAA